MIIVSFWWGWVVFKLNHSSPEKETFSTCFFVWTQGAGSETRWLEAAKWLRAIDDVGTPGAGLNHQVGSFLVDPMGSVGEKHGIIKKTSWVVSTFFHFYPEPWKWSNLTGIFFEWVGLKPPTRKIFLNHQNSMIRGCDIWHSCFFVVWHEKHPKCVQGFFEPTPLKNMIEPESHPIEKETHLPSTSMTLGFKVLIFGRVSKTRVCDFGWCIFTRSGFFIRMVIITMKNIAISLVKAKIRERSIVTLFFDRLWVSQCFFLVRIWDGIYWLDLPPHPGCSGKIKV